MGRVTRTKRKRKHKHGNKDAGTLEPKTGGPKITMGSGTSTTVAEKKRPRHQSQIQNAAILEMQNVLGADGSGRGSHVIDALKDQRDDRDKRLFRLERRFSDIAVELRDVFGIEGNGRGSHAYDRTTECLNEIFSRLANVESRDPQIDVDTVDSDIQVLSERMDEYDEAWRQAVEKQGAEIKKLKERVAELDDKW